MVSVKGPVDGNGKRSVGSCEVWSEIPCYVFSLWRWPPLCLHTSPQHLVSRPSPFFFSIKLTQTNYLLLKTQIMSLIEAQDLLSFVDGTGKEPKQRTFLRLKKGEIMNPEYVTWRRTDRILKSLMIGTMTEDVRSPTTRLRASRDIWMCLEKAFAQSSKDRELQPQCQLRKTFHERCIAPIPSIGP